MKNKIKIVVVGNCQARPIAELLQKLSCNVEVTKIAIVHLLKSEQEHEYKTFFEDSDHIIAQSVADNYPCEFVRTSRLKDQYGKKVTTIVNLFYSGYTPDWLYIRLPGKGTLKGPMGDYHNQTITESWLAKKTIDEATSLVLDKEYNKEKFSDLSISSLDDLRKREDSVDIGISDYIDENMLSKRLFFTFNHPCMSLLLEYVIRILSFLSLDIVNELTTPKEPLDQFIPAINAGLDFKFQSDSLYKGVDVISIHGDEVSIGRSRLYDLKQLTTLFYKVYSFNRDVVMNRFKSPNLISKTR